MILWNPVNSVTKGPEKRGGRINVDYKEFLCRLVRRARTRKKAAKKIWPRETLGPFFPRGLFTVSLEGLSERGTTRSLWLYGCTAMVARRSFTEKDSSAPGAWTKLTTKFPCYGKQYSVV